MLGYRHEEEPIQGGPMEAKKVIAVALAGSLILGGSVTFAKDQEGVNAGGMGEMENHPTQNQQEKKKKKSVNKHKKKKATKKTTTAELAQPETAAIPPSK